MRTLSLTWKQGSLDVPVACKLAALHLCLPLALFFNCAEARRVAWVLGLLTGLGVTCGFHRLLTHKSFETYPFMRNLLALLGTLACQKSPIAWVADHMLHHQESDQKGDPHSPRDGFAYAHFVWTLIWASPEERLEIEEHYAKKLGREPFMRFLHDIFPFMFPLTLATLFGIGYLRGGTWMAVSYVAWGGIVRIFMTMQITWAVNSICHKWGSHPHDTGDDSRNVSWLSPLTLGESMHNNHHAFPRRVHHGDRWYHVDLTYWLILALEKTGLAWNLMYQDEHGHRVREVA